VNPLHQTACQCRLDAEVLIPNHGGRAATAAARWRARGHLEGGPK